jgi:hypothetical protein
MVRQSYDEGLAGDVGEAELEKDVREVPGVVAGPERGDRGGEASVHVETGLALAPQVHRFQRRTHLPPRARARVLRHRRRRRRGPLRLGGSSPCTALVP